MTHIAFLKVELRFPDLPGILRQSTNLVSLAFTSGLDMDRTLVASSTFPEIVLLNLRSLT